MGRYDESVGIYKEELGLYYPGGYEHGCSYKNLQAFFEENKICYIPEEAFNNRNCIKKDKALRQGYTAEKLIEECYGNIYTAFKCLCSMEWEYPSKFYLSKKPLYRDFIFCPNCGGEINPKDKDLHCDTCDTCNMYYDEKLNKFILDGTLGFYKDYTKINYDICYVSKSNKEYSFLDLIDLCEHSCLCEKKHFTNKYNIKITPMILAYILFYQLKGENAEQLLVEIEKNLNLINIF